METTVNPAKEEMLRGYENWDRYNRFMEVYMNSLDVLEYYRGILVLPSIPSAKEDKSKELLLDLNKKKDDSMEVVKKNMKKVTNMIFRTQSEATIGIIREFDILTADPIAIWTALKNHFEVGSKISIITLLKEYVTCKQEGRPINLFLDEVQLAENKIVKALESYNEEWYKIFSTMIILTGLDDNYKNLTEQLLLKEDLTLQICLQKIRDQSRPLEKERNNVNNEFSKSVTINQCNQEKSTNINEVKTGSNYNKNWKKFCKYCRKKGHEEENCFKRMNDLKDKDQKNR